MSFNSGRTQKRIHLTFVGVWLLAIVPTLTIWGASVKWVGFISVWALVMAHFCAYLTASVEERQERESDGS